MKKVLFTIFVLLFSFVLLASCGEQNNDDNGGNNNNNNQNQQQGGGQDDAWEAEDVVTISGTTFTFDGEEHSATVTPKEGFTVEPDGKVRFSEVGEHTAKYVVIRNSDNSEKQITVKVKINAADDGGQDDDGQGQGGGQGGQQGDQGDQLALVFVHDDLETGTYLLHAWNDQGFAATITLELKNGKLEGKIAKDAEKGIVALLKSGETELGTDWANVEKQSGEIELGSGELSFSWNGESQGQGFVMLLGSQEIALTQGDEFEGFTQWVALGVEVAEESQIQLKDLSNGAVWTVTRLNSYSTDKISYDEGTETMTIQPGKFDFYFKFKFGEDEVYVGNASEGGEGEGGEGEGGDQVEASYSLVLNDVAVVVLTKNPEAENEFMALGVEIESDSVVKIKDNNNDAIWTFKNLDEASTSKISVSGEGEDRVMNIERGKYDFYFKFEMDNDTLYVGEANEGGEGEGGDTQPEAAYSLILNDEIICALTKNPAADNEYMALSIEVAASSVVKIKDNNNDAIWTFKNLDEASTDKISVSGEGEDRVMTIEPGKYDFYFKFVMDNDTLYVGEANNQE